MSDPISNISNIRPGYPLQPIQPSKKDRRSGRRRNQLPKDEPKSESVEDSDLSEEDKQPTIDEYI